MKMKTEYKHIYFTDISEEYSERQTQVWICRSNSDDDFLGLIKWYASWRQYCFYTEDNIVLAKSCLVDIAYFIIHLNKYKELTDGKNKSSTLQT